MALLSEFLPSPSREREICALVSAWASINTHSLHIEGVTRLKEEVRRHFLPLGGEEIPLLLPPWETSNEKGEACTRTFSPPLLFSWNPHAERRVLLGGHLDTVYPVDHPFQKVKEREGKLFGPGVTDMKGGIAILLYALEALQKSPWRDAIGWDVLLTTDEELGSPSSRPLWESRANHVSLALLFEPAFPDGSLVSARKGSANYTLIASGRAAHAGRNIEEGENALLPLIEAAHQAHALHAPEKGTTINLGFLQGGTSANVVPDRAICRINARFLTAEQAEEVDRALEEIATTYKIKLSRETMRPPKPMDHNTETLFEELANCGAALGETISWKPSGGVCDGNLLAACGIPTIDTLGGIGGNIHSPDEYLEISSLIQRSRLAALFLIQLANGEIPWPKKNLS